MSLVLDYFTDEDGTLLEDHYPDVSLMGEGWNFQWGAGEWEIWDNQATTPYGPFESLAFIHSGDSNATIEARCKIGTAASNDAVGLIIRWSACECFYEFTLQDAQDSAYRYTELWLHTAASGDFELDYTEFPELDRHQYYILKVDANGPTINCYVNNVLMCTAADSTWQWGTRHGLTSWHCVSAQFDNFSVEVHAEPPTGVEALLIAVKSGLI